MSKITFAEDAWEEYLDWQSQDKKTLKKINSLLHWPFDQCSFFYAQILANIIRKKR